VNLRSFRRRNNNGVVSCDELFPQASSDRFQIKESAEKGESAHPQIVARITKLQGVLPILIVVYEHTVLMT
jgi:hypothetical protein